MKKREQGIRKERKKDIEREKEDRVRERKRRRERKREGEKVRDCRPSLARFRTSCIQLALNSFIACVSSLQVTKKMK